MMRRWVWRSVRIHYHTLVFATDFCGYLQSISSNSRLTLTDVNPAQEKGVRERKANKPPCLSLLSPLSLT